MGMTVLSCRTIGRKNKIVSIYLSHKKITIAIFLMIKDIKGLSQTLYFNYTGEVRRIRTGET